MDIEYGKCDICGKDGNLNRKYYYYDIACNCCNDKGKSPHFEIVNYCDSCKPVPPRKVTVVIDPISER